MGQEGCTLIECAPCVSVRDRFVANDANLCLGEKDGRILRSVGILADMDRDLTFERAALDACFALEYDVQLNASTWFRAFQSEGVGGDLVRKGRESRSVDGSMEGYG